MEKTEPDSSNLAMLELREEAPGAAPKVLFHTDSYGVLKQFHVRTDFYHLNSDYDLSEGVAGCPVYRITVGTPLGTKVVSVKGRLREIDGVPRSLEPFTRLYNLATNWEANKGARLEAEQTASARNILLSLLLPDWLRRGRSRKLHAGEYFLDPKVIALSEAAADGKGGKVEELVKDGANANALGIDGITPLFFVIAAGASRSGMLVLLKAGANPNHAAQNSMSPMSYAVRAASSQYLEMMLAHGGDPSLKDSGGEPLWYKAILDHRWNNLLMLLDHGLDINDTEGGGYTIVMVLANATEYDKVAALIERGADVTTVADNHASLAVIAADEHFQPDSPQRPWLEKVIQILKKRGVTYPPPSAEVRATIALPAAPRKIHFAGHEMKLDCTWDQRGLYRASYIAGKDLWSGLTINVALNARPQAQIPALLADSGRWIRDWKENRRQGPTADYALIEREYEEKLKTEEWVRTPKGILSLEMSFDAVYALKNVPDLTKAKVKEAWEREHERLEKEMKFF